MCLVGPATSLCDHDYVLTEVRQAGRKEGRGEISLALSVSLCPSALVPLMSLNAPDPQPWYTRRYAIKLQLSHLVSPIGPYCSVDHCAPARRYAGTQKSRGRLDQLTLSAPSGSGSCPTLLPCHLSLSLSIKGSLLPHQITTARRSETTTDVRSTLEETHPGHTFNLSRVHQPPSERCVASPLDCDAIRYDVLCPARANDSRNSSSNSASERPRVEVGRVVPCLPFSRVPPPPVSHRVSTVLVLSDCATMAGS